MKQAMEACINELVPIWMCANQRLLRSQTKVENDYISEEWPTSAKILDVNWCALQFETVGSLMKFLYVFEERVEQKKAGSIKEIARCKNGWSVYDEELPSYTDIKLNVLVQSLDGKSIIAEIKFLFGRGECVQESGSQIVYNWAQIRINLQLSNDGG